MLGNDITAPLAIAEFAKIGAGKVFDRRKIALVLDHFTPNKDIRPPSCAGRSATSPAVRGSTISTRAASAGIEHVILPEKGLVGPGDVVIGADSHTCTYGALGAFATGVGSTDMAAGMATGRCWFKVPEAIRFELTGKPGRHVGGKDVILHIIGRIGVDGAAYKSMEFGGPGLGLAGHGRPVHHGQHGHRSRRQERHLRGRRHHPGLRPVVGRGDGTGVFAPGRGRRVCRSASGSISPP